MTKRALITGITGQDGSYLAELLLGKGYEVHGLVRRSSSFNRTRIDHLGSDPHLPETRLFLHYGDLADASSLQAVLSNVRPEEVYHLGAQSHVRVSFDMPEYTSEITGVATTRLLETIRRLELGCRFYQASSSEVFGSSPETPQRETTPFRPCSPYGAAKAFATHVTRSYRDAYNMFAVSGIMFNHESERRSESFVTRKITRAAGRIKHGLQKDLYLGNLEARRDWGHAEDNVRAMWMMLQQERPEDYVVGTGESHTVREFLDAAFGQVDLDWREHVKLDPRYLRPNEVHSLQADPSRIRDELGWRPTITFAALVRRMVDHDLELAAREQRAAT